MLGARALAGFHPPGLFCGQMAEKEAWVAEKWLVSLLSSKWDRPYSKMACFSSSLGCPCPSCDPWVSRSIM
ncbi:hypothetical protein THAOC_01804 [Thalassiosira oceanica]|uniref:Uncharacterized protein n=1 Tax=Thalassiosira oceanica TaxID=159749 RepID=K0TMQ6_THAOC|nr:hypothetical protein THAOC_01804 [Thalassiosira oceanica]|eukprot:EJK76431.1 hypothetical protein THAOC_01804 [Thalassiosira oceanica]